jgi:malonyl-CoA O-methyltransferase
LNTPAENLITVVYMNNEKSIDKNIIARSFSRGKTTYDQNAKIQQRVSWKLVKKLSKYPEINPANALEIGCCTGTLTELLLSSCRVEKLYLNDLVSSFYDDVTKRLIGCKDVDIIPMFGDIEKLPLPENLDLVISSATFQWLTNLESLFVRIAGALSDQGFLAYSIFGPGTLREFRDITNIGLQYSAVGTILDMMDQYFHIEEEETVKDQLFFSSRRDILRHLQATGVSGVKDYRWTPGKLREFENEYADRFGTASGIPVTYVSSYVIASKKTG